MPSALLIFFIFILCSPSSWSAWTSRIDSYLFAKGSSLQKYSLDASNRSLKRPEAQIATDLRPELKITNERQLQKVIFRPRWTFAFDRIVFNDTNTSEYRGLGKGDITDGYWEGTWSDYVRTTIGLQVYQWGPAEFLNASNPLYHLNSQQRSTVFKEKGQVLLRTNIDYSRNWNQAFIYQPISNAEPEWIEGVEYTAKGLVKTEWTSDSGTNSFGFVFGKEERSMNFIGEYFSFSPSEGFSLYLDSKHTENSVAYYPDNNVYGSESLLYDPTLRGGWVSFGVAGVRKEWSFLDFRFEYIYNTGGWTPQQFKEAKATLTYPTPDIVRNAKRFARPGLELLGRGYGYLSARFFNLGKKENQSVSLRLLLSEGDNSSTTMITYDRDVSNSVSLFIEGFGSAGPTEGELNYVSYISGMLGIKWSL